MTIVAIVGSRGWIPHWGSVMDYVAALPPDVAVITGDAHGVDRWARMSCQSTGRLYAIVPANWTAHGKAAGMRRNALIVALSERVVAFWDGMSSGTANTIETANRMGRPVEIIRPARAATPTREGG